MAYSTARALHRPEQRLVLAEGGRGQLTEATIEAEHHGDACSALIFMARPGIGREAVTLAAQKSEQGVVFSQPIEARPVRGEEPAPLIDKRHGEAGDGVGSASGCATLRAIQSGATMVSSSVASRMSPGLWRIPLPLQAKAAGPNPHDRGA
jgi:hypothetical protein